MRPKTKLTLSGWLAGIEAESRRALPVYETEPPRVRDQTLTELAKRFRMEGPIESKQDLHTMTQQKQVLVLYTKSAAFWYADFAKLHHPDYRPELPPDDQAVRIATEFLKQNNWLPEGVIPGGVRRQSFERAEGEKRESRVQISNNLCVDFRGSIDGVNTYGSGAKIHVYIGHKGEIIGLFHAMRAVHRYAEFPSLSRKEWDEVLRRKLGLPLQEIELRDVKLAYHAESPVLESRFVQPVYVFTLATRTKGLRRKEPVTVEFMTHPLPATTFAPIVTIRAPRAPTEIKQGEALKLTCEVKGGIKPFKFSWDSNIDGYLSDEPVLETKRLSIAHREGTVTSHTITVTLTDANGMQDSHRVLVKVHPSKDTPLRKKKTAAPQADDPYVGVEWCNIYHGTPGLADISGTDPSAQGFKNYLQNLPSWSSRFDWGNDNAWEEDFKFATAPGGGTDSYWSDNVHFAFFAGHGSGGAFYFGSTVDDHQMVAQDARWGNGILNWIVLHACNTMRANFEWTVWCDAFIGLHQMFGFHTTTHGSTPPLGSRFALWMTFPFLPWLDALDMQTAWRIACSECFDSSIEYAVIYADQPGTDTWNDHLPGYGHVSADPVSPTSWVYYKGAC